MWIRFTTCFSTARKLKMVLTFSMVKKIKRKNISWRENYTKFKFLAQVKFYWNIVKHSRLCMVWGSFLPQGQSWIGVTETMWPESPKYLVSVPLQKILANLSSKSWFQLLPGCSLGYLNIKDQSNYINSPLMRAVLIKSLLSSYRSLKMLRD